MIQDTLLKNYDHNATSLYNLPTNNMKPCMAAHVIPIYKWKTLNPSTDFGGKYTVSSCLAAPLLSFPFPCSVLFKTHSFCTVWRMSFVFNSHHQFLLVKLKFLSMS